jgi:hypothetical protein
MAEAVIVAVAAASVHFEAGRSGLHDHCDEWAAR